MKYCSLRWKPLCGICIILNLVSCAGLPGGGGNVHFAPVYVTGRAAFTLLSAAEMEKPLEGAQQLAGRFGGQEFIMDAFVQADEQGIEMALYNGFGSSMGSFSYSDAGISFQSPVFPPSFKAEYLAADFQFCFYRAEALKKALKKSGLVFEEETGQGGDFSVLRRIKDKGKTIIEIERTPGQVRYVNFLRGYSYILTGEF
jgi:phage protein U